MTYKPRVPGWWRRQQVMRVSSPPDSEFRPGRQWLIKVIEAIISAVVIGAAAIAGAAVLLFLALSALPASTRRRRW